MPRARAAGAAPNSHVPIDHHTKFPTTQCIKHYPWFDVNPADLPTCLLHGLPPAMSNRLHGTFWGAAPSSTITTQQQIRQSMGIYDDTRHRRHVEEAKDIEAQELYAEVDAQHLTARQAFQLQRGQNEEVDIAPPNPTMDRPPQHPNVYSDGSVKNPTEPQFSLGGAAAWHPQRELAQRPASNSEANIGVFAQQAHGLKVITHLQGHTGSSTRLEIAAAILAVAADGPIHLATDSQSFRSKALHVHHLIQTHSSPQRPWALQRDGDLWKIYHDHA